MKEYTDVRGASFSDADVERWGEQAEHGYSGGHLGVSQPGRPVSVGADARPFTLRLDAHRRAKLRAEAKRKGETESQVMRDLIDAL